jgi:hypothetical protein
MEQASGPTVSQFGRQATNFTTEDSSEEEDDGLDEGEHGGPTGDGKDFEFDDDVDLASPFLRGMLSDKQPGPNFKGTIAPAIAAAGVGRGWGIMNRPRIIGRICNDQLYSIFLVISHYF